MSEIFITKWHISDYAGRREHTMKSEGTINGQNVYACKRLTSWFRLGNWLIKHDEANYLLGLTNEIVNETSTEFKRNVKTLRVNRETMETERSSCVDAIVSVVNRHFKVNEYIETLLTLQRELEGYERCYYFSDLLFIDFNYKEFLNDKDAYQNHIIDLFKKNLEK